LIWPQWYRAAVDIDFARRTLDVEEQVSFAMGVRHHRAVHGVEANTPERAVEHGHSFTHASSRPVFFILLYNQDYIALPLTSKQLQCTAES
jgi:hypothetical protein